MMKCLRMCVTLLFLFCGLSLAGQGTEKKAEKMKIAVLDFTCIDLVGQKLHLFDAKKIETSGKGTLTSADRQSIDDRMQGFVRMMDARFAGMVNLIGVQDEMRDNARERAYRDLLAARILNSKQRPIVIGAEYMTAYLGEYPETFVPVNRQSIENALKEMDFGRAPTAKDAEVRIREFQTGSGASYVLFGTVADLKTEQKKFSGYGVKTDRMIYSLDVLIKVVDLKTNQIVFSGLFTGTSSQLKTKYAETVNDSIFQDLMKDALKQAAEKMNARFSTPEKS